MNKIYLLGEVENVEYGLVDKGKIYAIAKIDLKVEKNKGLIKLICENEKADYAYRFLENGTEILVEGKLRSIKKNYVVFIKELEVFS